MQSTEASGVRAVGVESRSSSASKGNSLAALAASISPLTYALALVALLAATLYILGDAARLVEIQRQHADLVELAAGQSPAAGAPRAIPTAFSVEPPPDGSALPQHAAIA
jgi:hypothetical protein